MWLAERSDSDERSTEEPDEGESTLSDEPVAAWETVHSPVPLNTVSPVAPLPPTSSQPAPPQILPPPFSSAAGAGGYRPVFDGGQQQSGAPGVGYGGTVYGGPPQGAPPAYGQQGYPQNNDATDVMGLLATWWMMRRARRGLRLLLVLPILFMVLVLVFVMHGCLMF